MNQIDMEDKINHPSHYTQGGVECIQAIKSALGEDRFCGFLQGNIIKYVWRYKHKNGVEDLHKAEKYLEWLIGENEND